MFYVFNRVQNFANIMNRLCTIQLGECHIKELNASLWYYRVLLLTYPPYIWLSPRPNSKIGVWDFIKELGIGG